MKKLTTLLLVMLCAVMTKAQKQKLSPGVQDSIAGTSIVLKNHTVIFQKVYSSKLTKEELEQKLRLFLPTVKNFQLTNAMNQNPGQLSGRITSSIINYERYDTSSWALFAYPLNANVLIQIRDQKYRVTISQLMFKDTSGSIPRELPIEIETTKGKSTAFRYGEAMSTRLRAIDQELTECFDLNSPGKVIDEF